MRTEVPPVSAQAATATTFTCVGDGATGPRVQVLCARASDVPDRYGTLLDSIRTWAGAADTIFSASAAETGGDRRIRFVHDPGCTPDVRNVVLTPRRHPAVRTAQQRRLPLH